MHISSLLENHAELTGGSDRRHCPVILSSRIRLARNLANFSFPGWAKKAERRDILSACMGALGAVDTLKTGKQFQIEDLSDIEKQILLERHLISRELQQSKQGSGVVISADQSCSTMVNEEDHLRIQVVSMGMNFRRLWREIDAVDTQLEDHLEYAFSDELGYLTACPTNVGTGMRASAMMHLPALVFSEQMEKVVRAVNHLGIAVRGLFGEGSDASGSIFQISNQQTLGESESDIIGRLTQVLHSVIRQEMNARALILERRAEMLFDKIGRAYGILRHGHILSSGEAMNHLSLIRLAVDFNMLAEGVRPMVDRLFIEAQPGHVQFAAASEITPDDRDRQRAAHMREHLGAIPSPDYEKALQVNAESDDNENYN